MKSIWNNIVYSGIGPDTSHQVSKRVKITNEIAVTLSIIASFYIFIFSFLGFTKEGLNVIFIVLSVFVPVIYNRYKLYLFARVWLLVAFNVVLFIYSRIFGEGAGIQIVFFLAVCLPWIIFEFSDSKYIFLGMAMSFIGIYAFYLTAGKPLIPITAGAQKVILLTVVLMMFVMYGLFMRFWKLQNYRSEKFLQDTYKQFFEDIPSPMWIYDTGTFKFLAVNQKAIEKYCYDKNEFLNMSVLDIRPPETIYDVAKILENKDRDAVVDAGYFLHRKKNGELFYAHILSSSTTYNNKNARVVLAIDVNDKVLTDWKNEELRYSLLKSEISNKYKTEFLANMSHELRTPLNSIMILANLLQEDKNGNIAKKQEKYANIIHNSGAGLLALIDDILELSKLEMGKIEIRYEDVLVKEVVQDMEQLFTVVAHEKKIIFTTSISKGAPDILHTDKQRLEQVIKNLLSNAFKFTPNNGRVILDIGLQNGQFAVSVTDDGIGIAPDKQDIIFEAFRQADGSISRAFGGTGLGLSISKNIVEKLQGEIVLESETGKGSTFTVLLPLQPVRDSMHDIRHMAIKA